LGLAAVLAVAAAPAVGIEDEDDEAQEAQADPHAGHVELDEVEPRRILLDLRAGVRDSDVLLGVALRQGCHAHLGDNKQQVMAGIHKFTACGQEIQLENLTVLREVNSRGRFTLAEALAAAEWGVTGAGHPL
jgi:hypothetical protein